MNVKGSIHPRNICPFLASYVSFSLSLAYVARHLSFCLSQRHPHTCIHASDQSIASKVSEAIRKNPPSPFHIGTLLFVSPFVVRDPNKPHCKADNSIIGSNIWYLLRRLALRQDKGVGCLFPTCFGVPFPLVSPCFSQGFQVSRTFVDGSLQTHALFYILGHFFHHDTP